MFNMRIITPAEAIVKNVCKIKPGEKVLIIANPKTYLFAQRIYDVCISYKAKATLIIQEAKTSFDNAEDAVLAAIKSEPDVCFSISEIKLGKDPYSAKTPLKNSQGEEFTHIFDFLLEGKKTMRAVWTPGITEDIFIPVQGRKLLKDDGNFSMPGTGGNIPAGEVFISPNRGVLKDGSCTHGKIVFDGSMTFSDGDSILNTPIECTVVDGFVKQISGQEEADGPLKTITGAERLSFEYEKSGKIPSGMGKIYAENARNIGELGIGLNIFAKINGNMLEDEKAFSTCHFAIGENYDNDAPSLIHLDGLVRNPTITLSFKNSSDVTIMKDGKFIL